MRVEVFGFRVPRPAFAVGVMPRRSHAAVVGGVDPIVTVVVVIVVVARARAER